MIARASKLDTKVTAIILLALFGFLLALALPVIWVPAEAEESGGGVRVWRGVSDQEFEGTPDEAFEGIPEEVEAAPDEVEEAPEEIAEEESAPEPKTTTQRARKKKREGIRVHGAQGRSKPLLKTHRAGQRSRGVPTYQTRHRAGGYPTGGNFRTHRAGTWGTGKMVTHRAGQGETGKIKSHRGGVPMRETRVK